MTVSKQRVIFYSWQSDRPNATNRGFIMEALERCAKTIQTDPELAVDPVVDRDTAGVAGSPEIAATIFKKIAAADVFVPDVSLVTTAETTRQSPNPNVLVELGFAISQLGWERIAMVMNTAFGEPPSLPFDLRGRRIIAYNCPATPGGGKADERKLLEKKLTEAIRSILQEQGSIRASEANVSRESLTRWGREFQTQRLTRLSAGQGPVPMASEKLICVHVVPYGAVNGTTAIDVGRIDQRRTFLAPFGSTGFNTTFNRDGLLRVDQAENGECDSFLQLFRNGMIETVNSRMMIGRGREDGLPSTKFVNDLATLAAGACRIFQELDVQSPVSILVSLVGVHGAPLLVPAEDLGGSAYYSRAFDHDPILLPEIQIADLEADVHPALRVALDALWQAAGQERCSCYDANGLWIAR